MNLSSGKFSFSRFFLGNIFIISIFINMMRNDDIMTLRVLLSEFIITELSHVYNHVAGRFNNIICRVCYGVIIMWT